MTGKVIKNISNLYFINSGGNIFEATARGKFKNEDIKPVVGDNVEFEVTDDKMAVINQIHDRKNYIKRPKVSNISQIVFVISPKMPNTNFVILDKELCLAEFFGINSIIVINKIDLDESISNNISNMYMKTGYKVIKMNAKSGQGIDELVNSLKNNTSTLAGQSGVRKVNYYK